VRFTPHLAAWGAPAGLPVVGVAYQSTLSRRPHTPNAFYEVRMRIHATFHRRWGKHEKCMIFDETLQPILGLGFWE